MLTQFAEKDSRIRSLRNEHDPGLAASLNRCIAESKGSFIAKHDCDDYCSPQRQEKQIAFLKANKDIGALGCNSYLFDENVVWGQQCFPEGVKNKDFLFNSPYKHGAVAFRREALLKAGDYRVAKETLRAEDYDLFMTMQTFCKGANLSEFLYFFCKDKSARRRRKYEYRTDEAVVRFKGFMKLGILPGGIPYVVKPLIVGMIPERLPETLKNKYYRRTL